MYVNSPLAEKGVSKDHCVNVKSNVSLQCKTWTGENCGYLNPPSND